MEFRRLSLSRSIGIIAGSIALALAAPAGAQTVIKIGSPTIKESVHHWMQEFEKRIEKRAGDRIDVKVFPLSQLGSIPRMVEGAQLGTIEMVLVPPAFLVGIDQRFQVLAAPGIFKPGARLPHRPRPGIQEGVLVAGRA